ncbi:hypothetical protein AZH53_03375 [Methanomicrobiaceae archaeon CYW5]|uniref:SLC13 family permease n=1 Tax=Methanovulcanius yangii TaxID=1789227 RepID=UPI0029CA9AEB|nr:SLC13 family permease [Methanovulcanius yangii]MBT8507469.1 hypothetical protein [Methanovulcanius yangii]
MLISMTPDAWLTLLLLIALFALLVRTKIPPWVLFAGAITAAMTLGLAPPADLLKGFSNTSVIAVAVLFMVAEGMYSTGAISLIVDTAIGIPRTLRNAQAKLLPTIAVGSAFLNNTPLVAMMIPVIRDITRTTGLSSSRLFMPLSYASILGGAVTLIGTSTNLIIAGLVAEYIAIGDPNAPHMTEIGMFTPSMVGIPCAVAGILFIMGFSGLLIRSGAGESTDLGRKRIYTADFLVEERSKLIGKTLTEAGFLQQKGSTLKNLVRDGREMKPLPDLALQAGDILLFLTDLESLSHLWSRIGLRPAYLSTEDGSERHRHQLVEVVVAPTNPAVGYRISFLQWLTSSFFTTEVVGMSRNGKPLETPFPETAIQAGDSIILEVDESFFFERRDETQFIVEKPLSGFHIKRTDKAITAIAITALMVASVALQVLPLINAALLATIAMLLTGCMTVYKAGKSIDFPTIIILACAIGLESAITSSGLSQTIADAIAHLGGTTPMTSLVAIFLGCIIMTNIITNAAAAAFMFPIGYSLAATLDVSFMPYVIVIMLGCSYAFINPAGYQTNMMVYEPGGYSVKDYILFGTPLTLITGILAVVLAPVFYPF